MMDTKTQKVIDDIKLAISDRDKSIMSTYEKELNGNIQPRPQRLIEMQRSFLEDPIRKSLINHLLGVMATVTSSPVVVSREQFERLKG